MTTLFEAVFIGTEYSRQGSDGLSGNTPQGMRRSADFQNIQVTRGRIFKLLRSPGIGSKVSIPPAYVVWRDHTTTLSVVLARQATYIGWQNRFLRRIDSFLGSLKVYKFGLSVRILRHFVRIRIRTLLSLLVKFKLPKKKSFFSFAQCCGSGSGIRDPVPFWPLDPGSGIGFFRIPDLGSRIPDPKAIFLRA